MADEGGGGAKTWLSSTPDNVIDLIAECLANREHVSSVYVKAEYNGCGKMKVLKELHADEGGEGAKAWLSSIPVTPITNVNDLFARMRLWHAAQDAQTFTFTHRQWADAIPMWKMGLNQGVAEACYASKIYCAVEGDEDDDPDSDEDDYYSPASPKRYCVPRKVTVRDSLTELEMEHALNVMFHPDFTSAEHKAECIRRTRGLLEYARQSYRVL